MRTEVSLTKSLETRNVAVRDMEPGDYAVTTHCTMQYIIVCLWAHSLQQKFVINLTEPTIIPLADRSVRFLGPGEVVRVRVVG